MSDFDVNLKNILLYESDVNQVNEKENKQRIPLIEAKDELFKEKLYKQI
ncbi:hypothetical protein [Lebetimonas sp. JS138]|nr:hypothetical protein [Lebetimonas sp. JS138]